MALSIPSGFIVGVNEPVDGRIAVTSRLNQSAFTAYLGLIVYDITEGKVYFLNDITDPSLEASWTEVGSGGSGGVADSVIRQPNGSTIDPIKFWSGTQAQYSALTRESDVLYNITDTPNATNIDSVVGTANEVVVVTTGDTATVSLDTAITGAISTNATNIATNVTAIALNTLKNSYPTADATKLATLSADSVDRQANGSTTDPIKFWSGTQAQYDALTPAIDVLYNITDSPTQNLVASVSGTTNEIVVITSDGAAVVSLDTAITSAIALNTDKTGITPAQSSEIANNTIITGQVQQFALDTTTLIPTEKLPNIQYGDVVEFDTLALLQASSVIWHKGDVWIEGTTKVHLYLGTNNTASSAVVLGDFRTINTAAGNVSSIIGGTNISVNQNTGAVTVSTEAEKNVQSDWDQTDIASDDYIKNKPLVPSSFAPTDAQKNVQSNWDATTGDAFILNKPTAAIDANTAKRSYPLIDENKLATLEADSVVRQAEGSTTDPIKFWSGTTAQYAALTTASDVLYNITDTPTATNIDTVLGTADQVVVVTSGDTATVSLDTAITDRITANDNKITYPASASTKLATIAENADVTLSSISAGANITISPTGVIASSAGGGGTITGVVGTSGQIDVSTTNNVATVKLSQTAIDAIGNNTSNIATNTTAIALNTLKVSADATLASDNVWTGDNTFNNTVQTGRVAGIGDDNTYVDLSASDIVSIVAGGDSIITASGGANELFINTGTAAIRGSSEVSISHGASDLAAVFVK